MHLASLATAEELERHDDPAADHHRTTSSGATLAAAPSDGFEGLPVYAVLDATAYHPAGGGASPALVGGGAPRRVG